MAATNKSAAERYIETYLALSVQSADEAATDAQLASILLSITERLLQSDRGSIVDVGCGEGTLLQRLIELPSFMSKDDWIYVGIDDDAHLTSVQTLSRKAKINRRVELVDLNDFYEHWPTNPVPQIIVCRNVLHELRIDDTAKLMAHVRGGMKPGDTLVIQDLLRFPTAERHNACWSPDQLSACLVRIGFDVRSLVVQGTRTGNAYINVLATSDGTPTDFVDVQEAVKAARYDQWTMWMDLEAEGNQTLPHRDEIVQALDIDLQVTALTRQLHDVGVLTAKLAPAVEKRVRRSEFTKVVEGAAQAKLTSHFAIEESFHFRERGEQLTLLENFLRGSDKLAVIHGGGGYGKTTLARRLLSTRGYQKSVVQIDGSRIRSAWAFLEEVFSQLGVRLAPEMLSVLGNLTWETIEFPLRKFFKEQAKNIIIFYDDFQHSLEPSGQVHDPLLAEILHVLIRQHGAKLIVAGRTDVLPRRMLEAANQAPVTVRVGRYATDQTVINILDDYFDRSAAGLVEYPQSLLRAIDRHPLITALAARALERAGADLLISEQFISELTNRLRDELWTRLVGGDARAAVTIAGGLRTPVPLVMLEALVSQSSVTAAREDEVIYSQPDQVWKKLWSTLGLFRLQEASQRNILEGAEEQQRLPVFDHAAAASAYRSLYRLDDDPKWVRESYYHQLLAGEGGPASLSEAMGAYYYDELVASADYHFKRTRNFELALDLYTTATQVRDLNQAAEMRRASCLVRIGHKEDGERAYRDLIGHYPELLGIKMSHVDALLYRNQYEEAAAALTAYGLAASESDWVHWQWGRAYLGLDEYEKAIRALAPLLVTADADPHFFTHYARALDYAGAFQESVKVLWGAHKRRPNDVGIATALAMELARSGDEVEAEKRLQLLLDTTTGNVQAAAAMIALLVKQGHVDRAKRVRATALGSSPPSLQSYVDWADAELALAKGRPELVLLQAKRATGTDPQAIIMALRAHLALLRGSSTDPSVTRAARAYRPPARYKLNARVQLAEIELAAALKDQQRFNSAKENLTHTRVTPEVLSSVDSKWQAPKPSAD